VIVRIGLDVLKGGTITPAIRPFADVPAPLFITPSQYDWLRLQRELLSIAVPGLADFGARRRRALAGRNGGRMTVGCARPAPQDAGLLTIPA